MILEDGDVKCDKCGKKFAVWEDDKLKVVCSRCSHYNVFRRVKEYISHKLLTKGTK